MDPTEILSRVSWSKPERARTWQRAFGAEVRRRRRLAGLTQTELGHQADLALSYVSSVERGDRNISLVNIHRLAEALGTTADALLVSSEEDDA